MDITNVGVRLIPASRDRLKAFCTITIDDEFVVRDLKVVEGPAGLFVAMPSRKRTVRCGRCGHKNEVRSKFCNDCGAALPPDRGERNHHNGKPGTHTDIAHPINSECRERVQQTVLEAFHRHVEEQEARRAAGHDLAHDETLDDYDAGEVQEVRPKSKEPERVAPAPRARARIVHPPASVPADDSFGAGIL
ncbi:MAG: stage V sporulation protein G [Phycisphaerales bacterium]|nr:MAG: stage V sporulation protein G [Phycisphaerales bacterium]